MMPRRPCVGRAAWGEEREAPEGMRDALLELRSWKRPPPHAAEELLGGNPRAAAAMRLFFGVGVPCVALLNGVRAFAPAFFDFGGAPP